MRYSVSCCGFCRFHCLVHRRIPFQHCLQTTSQKVCHPVAAPFTFPFSLRETLLSYRISGVITGTLAFVPFLWLCQFYFWKQYGEMFSVLKGPLCPFKVFYHPAGQTLSNVEMTFFTIISPRPFLYKAGHLCVLTLCKTRCSFGTTLCCEPLAIATFPAGLPPSQHRAYLA